MEDSPCVRREEPRLRRHLACRLAEYAGLEESAIDVHAVFTEYGLDSLDAVSFAADLERFCGVYLDPTAVWDHPTVHSLGGLVAREVCRARHRHPGAPA